ncbi:MAG: preprotein translocase subunit SecE [Actinobacteria bacterium]|nr:preprotein translocase subunit SecE [Actinomycetota bacterium]
MNREMRRLQEAEERRRKRQEATGPSRAERRAAALQARPQPAAERRSFPRRLRDYLHEVRVELRKVTWPTRDQMVVFTTVTLITTVVLTGVVFGLDVVAKQAVLWLVDRRG